MSDMKRLARVISFAAGIAAIIWTMRDRFISLALPHEPQPPTFRHPEDHPNVPHHPHPEPQTLREIADNDLTVIKGIGPVFATKLREMGVETFSALAEASPAEIAGRLAAPESRVAEWIDEAQKRL